MFPTYEFFSKFSIHRLIGEGKLGSGLCVTESTTAKERSRKILTLKELTVGNFTNNIYLSTLEKYIYHIKYVHIFQNIFGFYFL